MICENTVYKDLNRYKSIKKLISHFIKDYCIHLNDKIVVIDPDNTKILLRVILDRVEPKQDSIETIYDNYSRRYHMRIRLQKEEFQFVFFKYGNSRERFNQVPMIYIRGFTYDKATDSIVYELFKHNITICNLCNYHYTYDEMISDQKDEMAAFLLLSGVKDAK